MFSTVRVLTLFFTYGVNGQLWSTLSVVFMFWKVKTCIWSVIIAHFKVKDIWQSICSQLSLICYYFKGKKKRLHIYASFHSDDYTIIIAVVTASQELLLHKLFIYEVINLRTISSWEINYQGHVLHSWNMLSCLWGGTLIKHPGRGA